MDIEQLLQDIDLPLAEELPMLNGHQVENFFRPIQGGLQNNDDADSGYESEDDNKYLEEREPPRVAPAIPIIEQHWHLLREDEQRLEPELLIILIEMKMEAELMGEQDVWEDVYEGDGF